MDYESKDYTIFRKERQLSSALIPTEVEFIREFSDTPRLLKREHRYLLRHFRSVILTYDIRDFAKDLTQEILRSEPIPRRNQAPLLRHLRSAIRSYEVSSTDWVRNTSELGRRPPLTPESLITPKIEILFQWKNFFAHAFEKGCETSKLHTNIQAETFKVDFVGNFVVVTTVARRLFCTYAGWLNVGNLINSHYAALLYGRISDQFGKYEGVSIRRD